MSFGFILAVLAAWSFFGFIILMVIGKWSEEIANSFDFLNLIWIYNNFKVNWFGTIVIGLFLNILCPFYTIVYWFYKLCTVGR